MAALTLIRTGLRQRIRLVDTNNFSVELRCVLPVEAEAGFQWVCNNRVTLSTVLCAHMS